MGCRRGTALALQVMGEGVDRGDEVVAERAELLAQHGLDRRVELADARVGVEEVEAARVVRGRARY